MLKLVNRDMMESICKRLSKFIIVNHFFNASHINIVPFIPTIIPKKSPPNPMHTPIAIHDADIIFIAIFFTISPPFSAFF